MFLSLSIPSSIKGKTVLADMWYFLLSATMTLPSYVTPVISEKKYIAGEAIETYITHVPQYQDRLASTRQALSGDDIITKLLIGLLVMVGYFGNSMVFYKGYSELCSF